MSDTERDRASQLRQRFREIPQDLRDANQPFSVRVWRGLSWLERAEKAALAQDNDSQFIFLWIAFNAVYGCLEDCGQSAPDRATWQGFLADIVRADSESRLAAILWDEQLAVLRLVENRYLFRPFWLGQADAEEKLKRSRQMTIQAYNNRQTLAVLQELFERLYVMRQQVFHGAATSGSKLNRRYLELSTRLMALIVPAMIRIMIDAGPKVDWGAVCFPPLSS